MSGIPADLSPNMQRFFTKVKRRDTRDKPGVELNEESMENQKQQLYSSILGYLKDSRS